VRERYAEAARSVTGQTPQRASCCGPAKAPQPAAPAKASCCGPAAPAPAAQASCCAPAPAAAAASCCSGSETLDPRATDFITRDLYAPDELQGLPLAAHLASLGCGNPTALAELHAGETVLDLGSGGGIDVLLSARRVGPTGFAYGLDMTDEMLELAERNRAEAGVENVRFLKGEIESIPLPDAAVDVIISNCVINLSADKDRVLREAHRVLRPGGRFAVSDVVIDGDIALPEAVKRDVLAWSGCVAGALSTHEYRAKLAAAGFTDVEIEPERRYHLSDMIEAGFLATVEQLTPEQREAIDGKVMGAFIRARKAAS
jgi:arsenite methyltransferase